MDLVIEGLGADGDGVGRLPDGRVVFVPRAIPGDRVRVELSEVRHRVQFAELVELLEPSADRIEGRCRIEACGGCPLRDATAGGQARFKRDRVVETLRRIGKLDVASLVGEVVQVGDGWRYRHRVRLHATFADGAWRLGYFSRRSHELVPFSGCPVLWRELEQAAAAVGREVAKLPAQAGLLTVELAVSRRDDRVAARLTGNGDVLEYRRSTAWLSASGLSGVDVRAGGGRWQHGNIELRYDHGRADAFDLVFEPGIFTQSNPEANDRLVAATLRAVDPQRGTRVLELCAGIGNFSVPLGLAGASVRAVEASRRAAILCRRNARATGVAVEVRCAKDEEEATAAGDFDVVLLDPPRTGAREASLALAATGVARVVYIACDCATLARDAGILTTAGFSPISVQAFDLFPETAHVEVLMVLERSRAHRA